MSLDQHPDQDVAAASRDPNAGGVDLQDELGSERPGIVHATAMKFTGLAAAREIVKLSLALGDTAGALKKAIAERDAARKEASEMHAQRDRAERLLQSQATEIRILREKLRQAEGQTK